LHRDTSYHPTAATRGRPSDELGQPSPSRRTAGLRPGQPLEHPPTNTNKANADPIYPLKSYPSMILTQPGLTS
jgi:hypothetical protein